MANETAIDYTRYAECESDGAGAREGGRLHVESGCPTITAAVHLSLSEHISLLPGASVHVLLDLPQGWALERLESMKMPDRSSVVVATALCHPIYLDLFRVRKVASVTPLQLLGEDERPFMRAALRVPDTEFASGLTRAELRVVRQALNGLSTLEIAAHLRVNASTVNSHLSNVFAKTGCRDRAEFLVTILMPSQTRN